MKHCTFSETPIVAKTIRVGTKASPSASWQPTSPSIAVIFSSGIHLHASNYCAIGLRCISCSEVASCSLVSIINLCGKPFPVKVNEEAATDWKPVGKMRACKTRDLGRYSMCCSSGAHEQQSFSGFGSLFLPYGQN